MQIDSFQETVWEYYRQHGRHDLAWRQLRHDGSLDPYHVWVSEIMLQQTQVTRVIPKYQQFLAEFPDVDSLAAAEQGDVLRLWSGLGYNRRAKFLWQAAATMVREYDGKVPATIDELVRLPGIGRNTAAAILVYSHNQPHIFIETNIRTVFIHHFFPEAESVSDTELLPFIKAALDTEHPREWYWALMDYGTYMKRVAGNASRVSRHFTKQSAFNGSLRQLRGAVIRELTQGPRSYAELAQSNDDPRLPGVLAALRDEGLIVQGDIAYHL